MSIQNINFDKKIALTAEQMQDVDRIAVEEFNLRILQMMEIAAFQMANLIRIKLGVLENKKILCVAGKGNNGGDAIACARYLHNWGANPLIVAPRKINENTSHHADLAGKIGIYIYHSLNDIDKLEFDAIIDGVLGYSVKGVVRGASKDWIIAINNMNCPVFSYDLPSGLDPDDGSVHGTVVKANYTLTLAYPKKGLFRKQAQNYIGELYLADIGIPSVVYSKVKQKHPSVNYINPFLTNSLVRLF